MASGSTTPTSAGSFTEADVVEKLRVAADSADFFQGKVDQRAADHEGAAAPREEGVEMQASRPRLPGRRGPGLPRGERSGGTGRGAHANTRACREAGHLSFQDASKRMRGE